MFDLFRRRDRAVRILLGAILVMVAASMLLYLIPNYDTGSGNNPDQVVATVGKETITVSDVQKVVQSTMRNQRLPAEIIPNYIPQMVEQMVTDKALAYEADRLGFQVTDQDVRDAIKQMAPSLFPDGNFVGKDQYAAMLAQQNMTIPEFEDSLRRQILISRLRNIAVEGVVVSPAEIEQEYKKKYEKIKVQWVLVKPDMYNKESEPTEQDLKNYYDANKSVFQTPEKKNLAILIADQGKLEAAINPTDAQLQQYYNQNKESYRVMERIKVRHILLKTVDKPAAEDAKMKAKGEDLLKQIKAGANFAELAKKNSEDIGSAQNGGELPDWVTRGQTDAEFERVAFSLKPGQTSDLVKTQYGYHIIQVLQHEDARLRTFEEVKTEIAALMKKQQAAAQMQKIADQVQTALQKDPANPDKVATQFQMQLVKADGVEAGKPVPEVGTSNDFDQAIAPLKKGEVSAAVALPNNRIALAVVMDVLPPRPSTLEEVKGQIRTAILATRTSQAVRIHAQELYDKAKADGDLEKAAKSMGFTAKIADDVGRTGNVEGLGSANYLAEGFSRPDGSIIPPVGTPDGTVVAKVVAHIPPDLSKFEAERNTIRDQIKGDKARDRATLFEAGLREALMKQGKIKIRQQAIQNLVGQYKTS
ncbi:MAG TPA: peptidyl-prolyl cis-trans isomerase [Bryobacteraceae bacterium]|nr:peptidyl-prolyl cis-trans isomerase [Bryobacteraceae bacterium]